MTSYLEAPATKMLATHCAACGRPLVDVVSVEVGMGPDCRARLTATVECSDETRHEANVLIHKIAIAQTGMNALAPITRLRELGFQKLATKVEHRCASVRIAEDSGVYVVQAPFTEEATSAWRDIPGRSWNKEAKANVVPLSQRGALWNLLRTYYQGSLAVGPKGPFLIQ
jgi:hypothetical protein